MKVRLFLSANDDRGLEGDVTVPVPNVEWFYVYDKSTVSEVLDAAEKKLYAFGFDFVGGSWNYNFSEGVFEIEVTQVVEADE